MKVTITINADYRTDIARALGEAILELGIAGQDFSSHSLLFFRDREINMTIDVEGLHGTKNRDSNWEDSGDNA